MSTNVTRTRQYIETHVEGRGGVGSVGAMPAAFRSEVRPANVKLTPAFERAVTEHLILRGRVDIEQLARDLRNGRSAEVVGK